jgi:hypothetical protein
VEVVGDRKRGKEAGLATVGGLFLEGLGGATVLKVKRYESIDQMVFRWSSDIRICGDRKQPVAIRRIQFSVIFR